MADGGSDPHVVARPSNEAVIAKLFIFAILLAVVPLALLYAVLNGAADGVLELVLIEPKAYRTLIAALAAILAVNMVLVTYAVLAWREPQPSGNSDPKQD